MGVGYSLQVPRVSRAEVMRKSTRLHRAYLAVDYASKWTSSEGLGTLRGFRGTAETSGNYASLIKTERRLSNLRVGCR
ncbi:hypothetical protein OPQ81_004842 [Rhizoctonia solani]|nr:hypothetical protein OPQ81_004842 [Rhizoctonia solani]